MKSFWKKSVALLMMLVMLTVCTPLQGVAAQGVVASPGTGATSYASLPPESEAAAILGISESKVKELKDALYSTISNFQTVCDTSRFGIVYSQKANDCISGLISNTMPELFQINDWVFYHNTYTGNVISTIEFTEYKYSRSEYADMLQKCNEVTEYLTHDLVDSDLTPVQKALVLHDRLAVWVEYDQKAYENKNVPYLEHTMYAALWNGLAVCDGYAEAYMYLLREVGIESYVCRSDALDHAWNIVKVEGKLYHVDVTWDDPVWDVTGQVLHNNFLRSSNGIFSTGHKAYDYDTTPTDTKFDDGWPWFASHTEFQYMNGCLYYINNETEQLCRWEGNTLYNELSVEDTWWLSSNEYYLDNYSRLSADEHYLYYSLAKSVHRYDPVTKKSTALHYPNFSGRQYHNIFGMKIAWNNVYCDITDKPNFTSTTKKERQEVAWYRQNEVEYILIDHLPTKINYCTGEGLNTSGLRVKVRYTDGSGEYITSGFTVDGFNTNLSGKQTLTVSYGGHSATFAVTLTGADQIMRGNVDGNSRVDSTDARLVLQCAVGKIRADTITYVAADVDGNGRVDSTDARLILQYAVGKITTLG